MNSAPATPNVLLNPLFAQLGEHRHVLVGFSGGLDSSVLLHLLVCIREQFMPELTIRAIHIHHGLNPLADSWVQHCQQQCVQWQIPLEVVRVNIDARHNGIEAAARTARYQAFSSHLAADEVLLTAQHQDDQCETFLLALKRGSGPAGLSAMAAKMPFAHSQLLRPLLSFSRETLENYARTQQLQWIEDDSNQNDRFDRNFLRLRVLPLLHQRWPHFAQATARSAGLCAEQEQLLDELLADNLQQLQNNDGALSIEGLLLASEAKRAAILRRWLAGCGASMPSQSQLQRLWLEVAMARQDAEPQLTLGTHQVRRFRQYLYLLPPLAEINIRHLPWANIEAGPNHVAIPPGPLILPANLGVLSFITEGGQAVRAAAAGEVISVRFGLQGDIRIVGRHHSRQSKKLWQELGVPPWQRERIPLLYFGEQLIAAAGVFVAQAGQAKEGEPCWYLNWTKAE
ncbi:tRNA lysidine(34) synthetase TilS [Yersinia pekkanenii]|uniref:tRNA(Ile)-lysidine synthase n=1 Tax=Yersinia pekkanenii TaxID=1288385 RepID=A0A0T9P8E0_9GAMM|nr:tRNA lysidine(34) synthetase TilS [Yersinia pekkanenii]CNH49152.1 tRNA(Ile)-lysidine synthetase [Yersinia pekkanenii]CRY67907.1 tRNA(Ile)-lysidine synthetase [Yersinia pekkanenii]